MQRPSVYVGVSETSFSKPSPRHAPTTGYVVGEIEEVAHDDVRPPLKTSIGIWGLKPEEAVHLIPLTLILCGLIVSLPTFYNAYQGLPLSTSHRFGGSSAVQMQSMTSGDAMLIHPELGRGRSADPAFDALKLSAGQKEWNDGSAEEVVALRNVNDELRKRKVRSAGLDGVFEEKREEFELEGLEKAKAIEAVEVKKVVGTEPKKADQVKKEKKKSGRREKKKTSGKKKKGEAAAGDGRTEH